MNSLLYCGVEYIGEDHLSLRPRHIRAGQARRADWLLRHRRAADLFGRKTTVLLREAEVTAG
jgi:hypothetical protein